MSDNKWISGVWQTLLGAALVGVWGLWWSDRGRISKLENEKQIMENKYEDEISHLKNQLDNDNKTIWREIIIHENVLKALQMDIIEVRTTREIILNLARPQEWSLPAISSPPIDDDPKDYGSYEQKAAEIDDKTLETMVEQKGRRFEQHQQQFQQQQQQGP